MCCLFTVCQMQIAGLKKYLEQRDNLYWLKMITNYINYCGHREGNSESHSHIIDHELILSCAPRWKEITDIEETINQKLFLNNCGTKSLGLHKNVFKTAATLTNKPFFQCAVLSFGSQRSFCTSETSHSSFLVLSQYC